jgi:hypothetical protein
MRLNPIAYDGHMVFTAEFLLRAAIKAELHKLFRAYTEASAAEPW